MDIDADKILKAVLAVASALGLGGAAYQTNSVVSMEKQIENWRDEVAAVRAQSEAREIRDSNLCIKLIAAAKAGQE